MCCNKRREQRILLQQQQLHSNLQVGYQPRGCCGARKQRRLLRELEAQSKSNYQLPEVNETRHQHPFLTAVQNGRSPMAALIAVSIGIGAEKLGRKISEKRLEHKDKKAAEKREALYGHAESSSADSASRTKTSKHATRNKEKSEEARREAERNERRRSVSSERTLVPEQPPPRYEDVVRHDARRA